MTSAQIVSLLKDFGLPTTILVVVFVLLIKVLHDTNESRKAAEKERQLNQKNTEQLISLITKGTSKEHTKEEERINKDLNRNIDLQLEQLLKETRANRISFFSYHNGAYGVNGRSFQNMSVTNERIDFNTDPLMKNYQNIPRSMFPISVDALFEKGEFCVNDITQIKEQDPVSFHWWGARGAKSVYSKAVIDNIKGVMLGFITVEFTGECCQCADKIKLSVSKAAQRLSGLLQNKK